ncbi:MAG: ABC transporter substrate-binding protein [Burkholderiales bacterium]
MDREDRRDFLARSAALAGASLLPYSTSARAEPPPEIKKIRFMHDPSICNAPTYLAIELLRLDGFTELPLVPAPALGANSIADGHADVGMCDVPSLIPVLDTEKRVVVLAGIHAGCWELFANPRVQAIRDLKGKTVAISAIESGEHIYIASMLAYVGLNPKKQVNWTVSGSYPDSMRLFVEGKADAFLGFPPQPQELRAKKIGRVIVNTTQDRPWSQYFCCTVTANKDFVRKYPVATKRVVRAYLKATDICAREPERAARFMADKGYEPRYDIALEVVKAVPYSRWREANPEDSFRFHALRLHEAGMIKSTPQKIIAQGTDWRFLNELKKELKA